MPQATELLDPLGYIGLGAGIAGILALVFDAALFSRQERVLYLRITGIIMIVFGALCLVAGIRWIMTAGLPLTSPGYAAAALAVVGVGLAVRGVTRARRSGLSRERGDLLGLLSRVEDVLAQPAGSYIPLRLREGGEAVRTLARLLSDGKQPRLILYGETGSGKTQVLLALARSLVIRARERRHPELVALYVDLRRLDLKRVAADCSDEEVLCNHLRGLMSDDNRFDKVLAGPDGTIAWVFLLDAFDDFIATASDGTQDMAQRWLAAIKRFQGRSHLFRVVVATRVYVKDWPVASIAPLALPYQLEFARKAGMVAARGQLKRMNGDPALRPIVTNPQLLGLLLHDLRGEDRHDLVERAVLQRLDHLPRGERDAVVLAAEKAAYPFVEHARPSELGPLVEAGIARWANGELEFTAHIVEECFVTRYLVRSGRVADAERLITATHYRETLTTLLRRGEPFRGDILSAADRVLERVAGQTTGLVEADWQPTDAMPPPTQTFAWPPVALRVLQAVVNAGVEPSKRLQAVAIRMVRSAFVNGAGLEQRHALELLPMLPVDVAAWVVRQANAEGGQFSQGASELLAVRDEVFQAISLRHRAELLVNGVSHPELIERALREKQPSGVGRKVRAVVDVLLLFAVIFLPFSINSIIKSVEARNFGAAAFVITLTTLPATLFLVGSIGFFRLLPRPPKSSTTAVGLWAAFIGGATLLSFIATVITLDLSGLFSNLATTALLTWPLAMVAYLVMLPLPHTAWDVILPHAQVLSVAITQGLPRLVERFQLFVWTTKPLNMAASILSFVLAAALTLLFIIDLPAVEGDDELTLRGRIIVGGLAVAVAWGSIAKRLRQARDRRELTTRLALGTLTSEDLMGRLEALESSERTARFLKVVCSAPTEGLVDLAAVLTDLDRTFAQVVRLIPPATTKPIPPAVWEVGLTFESPGFREWLIRYDRCWPGRLSWLVSVPSRIAPVSECLRRLTLNRPGP